MQMNLPSTSSMSLEVAVRAFYIFNYFHTGVCTNRLCVGFFSLERTKLKEAEYPLVARLVHGPCEEIVKIFLMERDLGEEVTYDVSLSAIREK